MRRSDLKWLASVWLDRVGGKRRSLGETDEFQDQSFCSNDLQ